MREHGGMRHWASVNRPAIGPKPKPATKKLLKAIADRREHQKVLAQDYAERRREAAAWARNMRDRAVAAQLAKAAEKGTQPTADAEGNATPAATYSAADEPDQTT